MDRSDFGYGELGSSNFNGMGSIFTDMRDRVLGQAQDAITSTVLATPQAQSAIQKGADSGIEAAFNKAAIWVKANKAMAAAIAVGVLVGLPLLVGMALKRGK